MEVAGEVMTEQILLPGLCESKNASQLPGIQGLAMVPSQKSQSSRTKELRDGEEGGKDKSPGIQLDCLHHA